MKISLIFTAYNEEKHIHTLLQSIAKQIQLPNEVVIVDSQSTDKTVDIIKRFKDKVPFPIRIITKKTNRSEARNLAINKAKYAVVAVTDAGCVLDKQWLRKITQPLLDSNYQSVAGYYLPITDTPLQQAIAPFVAVMPRNFDSATFLPSSRSVAFTKQAWEQAGGYPEDLEYCEDLIFARRLKERTRMYVEKGAIVYWIQNDSYLSFFKQIKNYARGDIEAGYFPHIRKIISIFGRYLVFILVPSLFWIYLLWPLFKHRHFLYSLEVAFHTMFLQVLLDIGVMAGTIEGLLLQKLVQNKVSPARIKR